MVEISSRPSGHYSRAIISINCSSSRGQKQETGTSQSCWDMINPRGVHMYASCPHYSQAQKITEPPCSSVPYRYHYDAALTVAGHPWIITIGILSGWHQWQRHRRFNTTDNDNMLDCCTIALLTTIHSRFGLGNAFALKEERSSRPRSEHGK